MIEDKTAPQQIKYSPFGKELTLRYNITKIEHYTGKTYVDYKDTKGNIYTFDEAGNFVKYAGFDAREAGSSNTVTLEQAQAIAEDCIKSVSDVFEDYIFEDACYNEFYEKYEFYYYKKIAGIKTTDRILVWVLKNGVISMFDIIDTNSFNSVKEEEIKSISLQDFISHEIKNSLPDYVVDYEFKDIYLCNKEGEIFFHIFAVADCEENGIHFSDGLEFYTSVHEVLERHLP